MKCSKTIHLISAFILIVASMTYAGVAQAQVTTYEHCNFQGKKADVPVGKFTWPNLLRDVPNLKDNDISSIRVSNGYKATLYADPNYKGRSVTVTQDIGCLTSNKFNDTMSSIKVEGPVTKPPTTIGEGATIATASNSHSTVQFSDKNIASNIHFNKCLKADFFKPLGEGFAVEMQTCSPRGSTLQNWFSEPSRIMIQDTDLCLQAGGGAHQKVSAALCNNISEQNWTLTKNGEIKSGAGYCLNAVQQTDGYKVGKIITYSCTGNENQKWLVQKPKSEIALRLYAHKFDVSEIRSPFNNACLEVDRADPRKGGFNVRTDVKCERIKRPHWSADGETFKNDGLCLQSSGNNVIAKKCDGSFEQSWFIEVDRIGHHVPKLIESPSGKCLQVFPDAKSTYANVGLRDCDTRNPAQDWDMVRGQRGLDASDIPTLGPATVIADTTPDEREYAVLFLCDIKGVSNEETSNNLTLRWYDSRDEYMKSSKLSGLNCGLHPEKADFSIISSKTIPRYLRLTTDGEDAALISRVFTYNGYYETLFSGDIWDRLHDYDAKNLPNKVHCLSKDSDDAKGDWEGRTIGGTCKETVRFVLSDVAWD